MPDEEFTESQLKILRHFVTNTGSNLFVLKNLPEVIKGALFSRYSRSTLSLRSLLLKEFIANEEAALNSLTTAQLEKEEEGIALHKAQAFYDRILDGYGDDSIGELGGAHLAAEGVSMLAAKEIEECRIGGSPLEKSTRYIYFDQKVNGRYQFYQEPVLLTSAYKDLFLDTSNFLFDVYAKLIPPLTQRIEKYFPHDPTISKAAYTAALRAKVLDCLRGLLPAGTLTNLGVYGNGRFFETLLQKLQRHPLSEMQDLGRKGYQELSQVIPSFIRRAHPENRHFQATLQYYEETERQLHHFSSHHAPSIPPMNSPGVRLIHSDPDALAKVAAALLFETTDSGLSELFTFAKSLSEEELALLFDATTSARANRRHKSPRALEHASFTFELLIDYGGFRDLQRHRMVTQEKQLLTCNHGYFLPEELKGTEMEEEYCNAMLRAKEAYDTIASSFPEEAQYMVPMAYNIHWYCHLNLRAIQWLCELRSQAAGHATYRRVAQEMAQEVTKKFPLFERFLKFVDTEDYTLGRLDAEVRQENKVRGVS
ncbi:MAG: FAD-dependent thymidylate synthase [Verrucomicrobiota bacterium]|nr:FAD-dependent thymidylate synthase [Verrucomicrobiota bacterium]